MNVFDRVNWNKFYMVLPSPQIAIGLLLISIGLVVAFDIKIDLFKDKEWKYRIKSAKKTIKKILKKFLIFLWNFFICIGDYLNNENQLQKSCTLSPLVNFYFWGISLNRWFSR